MWKEGNGGAEFQGESTSKNNDPENGMEYT